MKLLKKLIAIPPQSGQEKAIQEFVASYLVQLGLKPINHKGNVIVKIVGQDTSKAVIFNAHVDTVAVGDKSSWEYGPFKGEIKEGKMYGLGASDEKATVAVLLLLAEKLVKNKPKCDIWLHFVIKEEIDGSGTKDALGWFVGREKGHYKEVVGVLGEPTSLKTIEVAHRGNVFLTLTTHGDSGHASDPERIKAHAVTEMFTFGEKLKVLGKKWEKEYSDEILGKPTIGLFTSITAGNKQSPNEFPDSCTATVDIRTTPKLHNKVLSEVKALDRKVKVEYTYSPLLYGSTSPEEKIVRVAKKVTKASLGMSTWSNDLCFFTEQSIPAIVYGPGNKGKIHNVNEYCEVENIGKGLKDYLAIIAEFGK